MQPSEFGFLVYTSSGHFFRQPHSLHWLRQPQRIQGKHIWSTLDDWSPHCYWKPKQSKHILCCPVDGENASLADYLSWIRNKVKDCGSAATRAIPVIYTQTIKQCAVVYSTLKTLLGDKIYSSEERNPKTVLLEMLHSCPPPPVKQGTHPGILPKWSRIHSDFSHNHCFRHGRGL